MSFMTTLADVTRAERTFLIESPIIRDALRGDITRAQYVAYLREAYFHVKQTVPLLMACGARLSDGKEWLREAIAHYIAEEHGHERWILDDIANCGADPAIASDGQPSLATELMVAYAHDTIARGNPAAFFGMVYVLEGTSVALATEAANAIRHALGLPETACRYLLSHGTIDATHVQFLESLLERFEDPADRADIVHAARRFYLLYGQIFRTLPDRNEAGSMEELRCVA
jgi:pyrroloquinoline quinone (PQQ) biosynthesis protein C